MWESGISTDVQSNSPDIMTLSLLHLHLPNSQSLSNSQMQKVHCFLYTAASFPDFPPPVMLLKPPPQPKVVSWVHPWLYDLERPTDFIFFYWLSYRPWVEARGSLWNHLACLCLSSPSTKSFHLPCLFWFKQNELKPLKVTFALIAIWTHLVPWSCLGKLKPHNES